MAALDTKAIRPSFLKVTIGIAKLVSQRATCIRGQCGAVIVSSEWQVLTTGYNGACRGLKHCNEVGCLMSQGSCVRAVHAEANAISQAARLGIPLDGGFIITTHRPCVTCAKLIIQAGLRRVYYINEYDTDEVSGEVMQLFRFCDITVQKVSDEQA